MKPLRGYFGIGAESISKPMNMGALMRTAHAFGASFTFSVGAAPAIRVAYNSDTSKSASHVPYYPWNAIDDMKLPKGCKLIGIELTDEAIDLPTFHHPMSAAYVLGGEARDLSPEMQARCTHIVKIPTRFCLNISLAGALVMYDRTISMGAWAPRPVAEGGPEHEQKAAGKILDRAAGVLKSRLGPPKT